MGVSSPAPKDSSADVTSFFKIMIGDEFSEVMFLPPKFAKTVSNLIDQKIQLEDAGGCKWTVTVSKYKGYLAFHKGWHAFSVEHGLKIGEFLVFNCLKHTHFLVTIYGRNGCAKLPLTENQERKRKRTNERSNGRNKHIRETDSDNVKGQCSNTSAVSIPDIEVNQSTPMAIDNTSNTDDGNNLKVASKTNCTNEQFYMINKDVWVGQSELKDSLYDLASFEMRPCDPESGKTVFQNGRCGEDATIPNIESEASRVEEIPISGEVQSCHAIPEVGKLQNTQKSRDIEQKNRSTPVTKNVSESNITSVRTQCRNIGSGKEYFSVSSKQLTPVKMSDESSKRKFSGGLNFSGLPKSIKPEIYSSAKEHFPVSKKQQTSVRMSDQSSQKFAVGLDFSGLPKSFKSEIYSCGKSLKVVKEEKVEMKTGKILKKAKQEQLEMKGAYVHGGIPGYQWIMKLDESYFPPIEVNNHVPDAVKAEPIEIYDFVSTVVVKITISEAPRKQPYLELPDRLFPVIPRIKQRSERKVVVYLLGPVSSVLKWPVLYYERFALKILTSGWEAFRKANSIRPGDECVFKVEDFKELILRVMVVRN